MNRFCSSVWTFSRKNDLCLPITSNMKTLLPIEHRWIALCGRGTRNWWSLGNIEQQMRLTLCLIPGLLLMIYERSSLVPQRQGSLWRNTSECSSGVCLEWKRLIFAQSAIWMSWLWRFSSRHHFPIYLLRSNGTYWPKSSSSIERLRAQQRKCAEEVYDSSNESDRNDPSYPNFLLDLKNEYAIRFSSK